MTARNDRSVMSSPRGAISASSYFRDRSTNVSCLSSLCFDRNIRLLIGRSTICNVHEIAGVITNSSDGGRNKRAGTLRTNDDFLPYQVS